MRACESARSLPSASWHLYHYLPPTDAPGPPWRMAALARASKRTSERARVTTDRIGATTPRARERLVGGRGRDRREEGGSREVVRMRPGTRGGYPARISRGRRCRRPKALVARVVDAPRFPPDLSSLSEQLICALLLVPLVPYPATLSRATPSDIYAGLE